MKVMDFQQPHLQQEDARTYIKTYASDEAAVFAECCNDAVHILYPHRIEEAAKSFLNGFEGTNLYAVKANPSPVVLKTLWNAGIRDFDVASLREIELVHSLLPHARMHFMHPVKSREAIRYAYRVGIRTFSFDHIDELRKIQEETAGAQDLALFLRLKVDGGKALYDLGGKFGVDVQSAPLLLERARQIAVKLGVCFHVGSQCMDPNAFAEAIRSVAELINTTGVKLDALDIGGGFPSRYPGMEPPKRHLYFDAIHEAIKAYDMTDLELISEPGRAMIADAGAVAVRVELRKGADLYLNDGTYGALFDAGTPDWPFPVRWISASDEEASDEIINFRCFGPTCDSCDKMNGPFPLPANIAEGDWIIFEQLGAYGFAMQSRFNGFYSETLVAVSSDTPAVLASA